MRPKVHFREQVDLVGFLCRVSQHDTEQRQVMVWCMAFGDRTAWLGENYMSDDVRFDFT